jgi:glutamate-5-semialdehyde dehydrogenase
MKGLTEMAQKARDAAHVIANVSSETKNKALLSMADSIEKNVKLIMAENKKDLEKVSGKLSDALIDRIRLKEDSLSEMAKGLRQIAEMQDPVGEVIEKRTLSNGLELKKVRVPFGVIVVIYESRPNVTVDTAGLTLKSGNVVILKGGSDAINSNKILAKIISEAAFSAGIPKDSINFIESTEREYVGELLKMNKYVDVVIPRGGHNLIQYVLNNSTIPVIETGEGNCHIYVDDEADLGLVIPIVINSKTQRPGTCNSVEKVLIHKDVAQKIVSELVKKLKSSNVNVKGDKEVKSLVSDVELATEQDWKAEYLDLKIAIKIVDNIDEAISHINKYGTKHSESIITKSEEKINSFMNKIDAAVVLSNASTRFTDGFQLGMGAEIGISTQKLHARGPMGIKELTTYKLEVFGTGQTRK